jgi:FAD/FMN-containing dehydrogenase
MKPAQIKDLRTRLTGSITDAKSVCEAMSTDASVLRLKPTAVAYPVNTADVQATVGYAAEQAAKKSKGFSVVARGLGHGRAGGALGNGVVMDLSAHLNRILRLSKNTVTVQPGVPLATLQAVLQTHGRMLPVARGAGAGTIGGLVASGGGGASSLKYGQIAAVVRSLRVVLDDGSAIEVRRLGRRELNRKKGLMTREGDLYRGIDGLLQDHRGLIRSNKSSVSKNSGGYRLLPIKGSAGSFDLSQLLVGSEGTLGLITEITLETAPFESRSTLLVGGFATLELAGEAALKLAKLGASRIEFVDQGVLAYLRTHHPNLVPSLVPDALPMALLFAEFDNPSHLRQNLVARRAERVMSKLAVAHASTTSSKEQVKLQAPLREGVAALTWMREGGGAKALPLIDDAIVPAERWAEAVVAVHKLLNRHKQDAAVWGDVGNAHLHMAPIFDLTKPKQRDAALKLMDEFTTLITGLDGTIAASGGDGMLNAPYLEKQQGKELAGVMRDIKQACDPNGVFNPRAITGTTKRELEELLRHEYADSCYDW